MYHFSWEKMAAYDYRPYLNFGKVTFKALNKPKKGEKTQKWSLRGRRSMVLSIFKINFTSNILFDYPNSHMIFIEIPDFKLEYYVDFSFSLNK